MNENVLPDDLVDDTIWLEVDLPIVRYADSIQLGRNVAPLGQLGKRRAEGFQLIQYIICVLYGVLERNVAVDVDEVLLCILGKPDTIAFHSVSSLMCLRTSAKAFPRGLLRPS